MGITGLYNKIEELIFTFIVLFIHSIQEKSNFLFVAAGRTIFLIRLNLFF